MRSVLRINAGGRIFQTLRSTITRFPRSPLADAVLRPPLDTAATAEVRGRDVPSGPSAEAGTADGPTSAPHEVFLDVDPAVFAAVLQFLRSGTLVLPRDDEPLRAAVVHQLQQWDLLRHAFPAVAAAEGEAEGEGDLATDGAGATPAGSSVRLPDVVVVQLCDHMTHDQGIKRHAMTVTFGADGFRVRDLCVAVRRDLRTLVAKSFWQCQQTNERAMFFVSSRVNNATADVLMTSVTQQIVTHTEQLGYSLQSSYVTLSPDVQHTSVRMFIHNFIFRRVRQAVLEDGDALVLAATAAAAAVDRAGAADAGSQGSEEAEAEAAVFRNFEAPSIGPQGGFPERPRTVAPGERVDRIWDP